MLRDREKSVPWVQTKTKTKKKHENMKQLANTVNWSLHEFGCIGAVLGTICCNGVANNSSGQVVVGARLLECHQVVVVVVVVVVDVVLVNVIVENLGRRKVNMRRRTWQRWRGRVVIGIQSHRWHGHLGHIWLIEMDRL